MKTLKERLSEAIERGEITEDEARQILREDEREVSDDERKRTRRN